MNVRTRPIRALVALAAAVGLLATGLVPSHAEPPTDDPALAADYGAGWLAAQIEPDGSLPGGFDPLGDAANAALSLAAAGVGGEAFDRAVDHIEDDIDAFVAYPFDPSIDDPGRLAKAIMLAEAAGADPRSFGGTDLVARLSATLGALEPGLYGANDPTFDGVFRQGLAITALIGVGETVPASAVQWLLDQQCSAPAASAGGWEDYRADPAAACAPPDPATFSGPDTNSTAMAIMAAEAAGAPYLDPRGFLEAAQEDDGGWGFVPGSGTDPNSTSYVVRALVARGEDPGDWTQPGGDAWGALLAFQQGCDAAPGDRGAFTAPFADPPGSPDVLATIDGVAGAAGLPYPLPDDLTPVPGAPEVDCDPDEPTGPTDPDGPGGTPAAGGPAGPDIRPAGAATPVGASPRFTG